MPYINMKEIWTPLKLVGVKFYRDADSNSIFIKVRNKRRHRIK